MTILLLLLFIIAFPTILNLLGLGVIFSYMVKLRVLILIAVIGIIAYVIYNIFTGKKTFGEVFLNSLEYTRRALLMCMLILILFLVYYTIELLFMF